MPLQSLDIAWRFPGLQHDWKRMAQAAAQASIWDILAASAHEEEGAAKYADLCDRCAEEAEPSDSRTCHRGPLWLDLNDGEQRTGLHRDRLLARVFRLPDTPDAERLGADVCEEMEVLVFGSEKGSCSTRRRWSGYDIEQYRRWVRFAVLPHDSQLWVCCQLAEGSAPFDK